MSELEPNYLAISTDDPLATDPLLGGDTFPGSGFDNSPLPAGEELLNLYPPDKGDKLPGAVETILTAADPGDWLTPTFEDNQKADNPDGEKDTLTGVEKEPLEGGDTLLGSGNAASNTTSDRESEIAGDNSESDNSEANTTGEGDATTAASGDNTPTSDNLVIPEAEPNKEVGELTVTDTPEEEPNKEVGELTVTDTPEEEQLGDQVAHIREEETDKEVGDIASDSGKTLVNLSPEEEAAIYQRMQPFTGGVFKVGDTGEVGFDFLYDGGSYKGELAIFSLVGMGEYEPGSPEFIAEAARRASSNSPEGYIVISDPTEGARFNGLLNPYDTPRNQGEYKGVKTFAMTPGDEFGVILVPNGTIQEVLENPNVTGFKRPLFSMTLANPHEAFHVGQIADVTGDGHTYVLEDKRLDSGSDGDYDDFIFQVRGATAQVIHLSEVINPKKDWRQSEEGKALVDYAELSVQIVSGYIEAVKPELSEIVVTAVESAENLDNYQAEDLKATQEWVIWINPAQNSDSLARLFGAENLGATGHIDDTYIWKFPKELTAAEVKKSLEDLIGSDFAYPLVPIKLTKPQYLPKDPLVEDQWHIKNTGQTGGTPGVDANILDALNLATGNGIVIGIVDDGVESGHIDLQDNFREDLSIDFNGTPEKEYPLDATPDVDLESNWWWWFWQWYNRYYQPKTPTLSRKKSLTDPDQVEETSDPFQHGTAVAGIAAADNNGEGVSGVAPDAELASVRLTADLVTEKQIADALAHEPQAIAIYNNSWKPDAPLLAAPLTLAALENGVKAGRNGKGNIYVFAGGNDGWLGENVNSNPFANSRYTIAVGAIDHNGTQAWYSEPGASLLVSAPSSSSVTDPLTGEKVSVGITTTDLQGEKGYNSGTEKTDSNTDKQNTATDLPQKTDSSTNQTDITNTNYTNRFGGTSAAAPIVSGVVALMLEANPDLTWRDVQHILVETATKNNPTDTDWVTNSGGYQVNQKYGFGTVNGAKAVQAAQTWTNVAPEIAVKSSWQQVNQAIPDYDTVGLLGQQVADILSKNPTDVTEAEKAMLPALPPTNPQSVSAKMDIAEDINIEWVEVVFEAQHTARGDLKVTLVAPDGTESLLTDRHADPNNNYDKWTFTSNRHWGESSQGEWTLKVADEWGNEVGTWNGWKLNFYGTENPTVNIRATDNNATEDGSSGQYIVTRTGGNINKPLTVQYQIGGSATNGSDYTINGVTSPQTITFAPGQTTATIGINPIHDYEVEPSQNVQLSLVDAGGYHLGTDTAATVTITNSTTTDRYGSFVYVNPANGHQYILSEPDTWLGAQNQAEALGGNLVAINDAAEQQWIVDTFGTKPFWIGLTDSEIYGKQTGNYQWVNGEPATYTNWLPGQPSNSVWSTGTEHFGEINRQGNGRWNDLTYNWLSQPGIIEIDPATIAQPIVNLMVTDAIAGEDGNAGQIVIQRLGNLNQNLTINYTVGGDTTNGSDYRGLSGSLTIPAGETLATMPIIALPDDVIEANETVVVNLAAGDYQIGSKPSGHVIIADQNPINRIANEVIGRDVALLAYWTQRWQNGETLAQLRPAIIAAANDGLGNNDAETKIAQIYQDILGRAATSSEIASARSQLETGATLSELRQQLEGADIIDTPSYVYTNPATGNRYFLTTPDTWLGAQEQAQALGGNLVTIDDAAENQWLVDTFGGGLKWIGLNDSPIYGNTEGDYQWVSGEATYTNWWPTAPNNVLHTPEGEDFSETNFLTPGLWNDLSSQQNFLRQGIVEITAPPPPIPDNSWLPNLLGTVNSDQSRGVVVDNDGNVYIAGGTNGSLDGNTNASGINANFADPFLTKYDALGNKLWTRQPGSTGFDYYNGIANDASGNIYTVGYDDGPGQNGSGDITLTKWDSDGNQLWRQLIGTAAHEWASGVTVDSAGHVYIAGYSQSWSTGSPADALLAKYDSDGNLIWQQTISSTGEDMARSVVTDAAGNVYVAGVTTGSIDGNTNAGSTDIFLTKFNAAGVKLWTEQLGTPAADGYVYIRNVGGEYRRNVQVALDKDGNIYLSGTTEGSLNGNTNAGGKDAFLVKYDRNGTQLWTEQLGTAGDDRAWGVTVDKNGIVYLTGTTQGSLNGQPHFGSNDTFVMTLDSDGNQLTTRIIATANDDIVQDIKVDRSGNIYTTGNTTGSLANTNAGNYDVWVSKNTFVNMGPIYTNPVTGNRYFLTTSDTWIGAQNQAVAAGGNLVTINNAAEQAWLVETFGNDRFYIGLTDSENYGKTEGNFRWVSGQPVTYTNWDPAQPDNTRFIPEGEDFAEMLGGLWNDLISDLSSIGYSNPRGIVEIEAATPTNLIQNGDFEAVDVSGIWQTYTNATLPEGFGWSVANANIDLVDLFWSGVSGTTNPDGIDQSLDIDSNATVSQTFTTEVGQTYELSFWYAHNPTVQNESSTGYIDVTGNNSLLSTTLTHDIPATLDNMQFVKYTATFTADSNSTTLSFQGDAANSGTGFVIDDVRVAPVTELNYEDFSSLAGLNLIGSTVQLGDTLRLTPKNRTSGSQAGAVWHTTPQSVEDGFETTFQFQINDLAGSGGDGFAFVIQNSRATAIGGGGGALGYTGIYNSLAVEFDTYDNDDPGTHDPNGNHLSVHTGGTGRNSVGIAPLGVTSDIPNISDGEVHTVKVKYIPGTLQIFMDDLSTPVLTMPVDLGNTLNLDNGKAWVGFTAAASAAWENHDILNWTFSNPPIENPSYNWTWTYFGEDLNPNGNHGVLTNTPNVDDARNAFLANLINIETEDFESFVDRETPSSLTFGSETATVSGVTSIRDFSTGNYNGDGTYPISGNNYLFHYHPSGTFTLDFDTPQSALGFTLTDAGDLGGQLMLTLHHEDGTTENLLVPHQHQIYRNSGSAVFFGITDTDKPLTAITFTNTRMDGFGLDDLIIGQVNPNRTSTPTPPNQTLNLTYTEDTALDLSNIVITDPDGQTEITLTLSNPAAGVLTTGVGTGQYNATTGVWTASGAVADVNAALADLQFVPTSNFNQDVSIAVVITDDFAPALTGTINLKGIAVNDAPTLTTTSVNLTGATENAGFTVTHADLLAATGATDVDGNALTFRIQTLGSDIPTKNGQPVTAGVTTLSAGEAILWTPTTVGNAQPAFTATLTDGKVTVATPVTVSVDVNPVIVTIDATDPDATEGSDSGQFTFTRTGDTSEPLIVTYGIDTNGFWSSPTATNGSDYEQLTGSITIPGGASSVTLPINTVDDSLVEWPERVKVYLTQNDGYEIGANSQDEVKIWDNETPEVLLYVERGGFYDGAEPDSIGRFLVRRIGSLAAPLTINYSIAGTATPGTDYTNAGMDYNALTGRITIPANNHDQYIIINPIDDSEVESGETIEITLNPDANYTIKAGAETKTINLWDNENRSTFSISVPDSTATEGGDSAQFAITRTGDVSKAVTVYYEVSGDWHNWASNGNDYEFVSDSITFEPGQTSRTIDINPIDDDVAEVTKTVIINLKSDSGYNVSRVRSGGVRIFDNETPTVEWQKQFGTSADDVANSVAVDSAGNVYTVGSTTGNFGGTNSGGSDVFIAKRNSSDSQLWQMQLGTADNDGAKQIALDSANNLYILGWSGNSSNSWIAKYDSNGTQQWQKPLGNAGYDIANGALTIGNDGSLYVTGGTTGNINGTNQGATDAWVAKYDSDGNQTWVKQFGTADEDEALGIAVDNTGKVYITGNTKGSLAGTREGDGDAWVAQLDSSGNLQWQTQLGTTAVDIAYSVAVDNNGRVYIGGQTFGWLGETYQGNVSNWVGDQSARLAAFQGDKYGFGGTYYGNGDAWVAQLNSTTGAVNWKRLLGTTNADSATKVVADSLGNVYLAGRTQGKLATSQFGADDIFLAKYNLNGALQWKQQLGTAATDIVNDMVLTSSGIYLTGDTTGNLQNTNKGGKDAWVIHLA